MMSPRDPSELQALLELMVKHDVVQLAWGDLTVTRALVDKKPAGESPESEFDRMMRLSPDKQDAALMLRKVGGGG